MKLLSPVILTLCVVITAVVLMTPSIPLGVPGEWVWQRHAFFANRGDALERLLPGLIGGGVLFGMSMLGVKSLRRAGRGKMALLYAGLIIATAFWINRVQQTAPMAHRTAKPWWVLYDPSASGYFFEAVYRMHSTSEFLAGYEARMEQGEVLHIGTHPPGLFLLAKGCLTACRAAPAFVTAIQTLEDQEVQTSFRFLEQKAGLTSRLTREEVFERPTGADGVTIPLTNSERAALQLMSLLSGLAVALTILPFAFLCRLLFDRLTAWKVCCLWGTLPCLAVFAPKSDVLFPLTCTSVLAFAVAGMTLQSRWRFVWLICAGSVLWLGMMMTLAHITLLAVLLAFVGIRTWQTKMQSLSHDCVSAAVMFAAFATLCVWWTLSTDCDILNVWRLNLANHAGFYEQFTRTWWKWLLVNPIEIAFAIGLPLFAVMIAGAVRCVCQVVDDVEPTSKNSLAIQVCLATAVTADALWLSGKNQGEAARLWCFLTPWLLMMAGQHLIRSGPETNPALSKHSAIWRHLLLAQLIVAIFTVSQVSGFSF